jgi:cathepsin D
MAAYNMNPVFDSMMHQNKLEKNMFSFYLTKDDSDLDKSEFTLGGYNQDHVDGDIHWHKVVDEYYWTIKADNILVGGKDIGVCKNGCKVIADTGTSIMTAPTDDLSTLLRTLDVRDHCHELDTLPTITFQIDGVDYNLQPEEYVKPTNVDKETLAQVKPGADMGTITSSH